MNEIDKLAWICLAENKVLMARSKNKDTFYLPGGKRDQGESDQQALIREIKEELTVDLVSPTIKYAGSFKAQAHGKAAGVIVKTTCYLADFIGNIKAAAEIEEVLFVDSTTKVKYSPAAQLILAWLKKEELIA